MLHLAIDLYGEQIVLLKHDGFSTRNRIEPKNLIIMVRKDVGIDVGLSAKMHRVYATEYTTSTTQQEGRKDVGLVLTCTLEGENSFHQ